MDTSLVIPVSPTAGTAVVTVDATVKTKSLMSGLSAAVTAASESDTAYGKFLAAKDAYESVSSFIASNALPVPESWVSGQAVADYFSSVKDGIKLLAASTDAVDFTETLKTLTADGISSALDDTEDVIRLKYWDTSRNTLESMAKAAAVTMIDMSGLDNLKSDYWKRYNALISGSAQTPAVSAYREDPELNIGRTSLSRNKVIDRLLSSNPDIFSNMYDAVFFYDGAASDIDPYNPIGPENYVEKQLLAGSVITVRTVKVAIPQDVCDTFSVNFLQRKIDVPGTSVAHDNQSSITLRLDENAYILDAVQTYAGRRAKNPDSLSYIKSKIETAKTGLTGISNMSLMPDIAATWTAQKSYGTGSAGLCLRVSTVCPWLAGSVPDGTISRVRTNFVFESVRFLGSADSLNFSQSDSEPGQMSFPFIYRRCYSYTDGTDGDTVA